MNNLRWIFTRGLRSKRSSAYLREAETGESSDTFDREKEDRELLESEPRVRVLVRSGTQALLSSLENTSRFTKKEVNLLYREFKHECPAGFITKDQFRSMYRKFFPMGGSNRYAGYVFDTFDRDQNGNVTFQAFLLGMSVLSRGSQEEKLKWIFNLYDIDKNGYLTKNELVEIVSAVYEMRSEAPVDQSVGHVEKILAHASTVFQKMDVNGDGIVSFEEFVHACQHDQDISKTLGMLNGGVVR